MSAVRKANPFLQKDFAGFGAGSRDFMTSKDIVSLQKKEISNYQLPHLLRYEDKNSMAFSIETRLPFLDYRLVEFALNLPSGDKIKNGWTKFILRDSTKGIVPDAIRWRKYKIGFEVTEREWLKKLEQKIIDKFSGNDFVSKRYLDGSAIAKSVLRGGMPLPTLWRVYNLELWAERFGVGM
jgi:asparagine synthase (glutamine-hydrolysing)